MNNKCVKCYRPIHENLSKCYKCYVTFTKKCSMCNNKAYLRDKCYDCLYKKMAWLESKKPMEEWTVNTSEKELKIKNPEFHSKCVICLDTNDNKVKLFKTLECGHEFHNYCIVKWSRYFYQEPPTCPICRNVIAYLCK